MCFLVALRRRGRFVDFARLVHALGTRFAFIRLRSASVFCRRSARARVRSGILIEM